MFLFIVLAQAVAAAQTPSPLPHQAAGVVLGAERATAEKVVGSLKCHENQSGFQVCTPTDPVKAVVQQLELFFYADRVVSIAYAEKRPDNAWGFLDERIRQFGTPSLSSRRERDKAGRTHEVFGWKDDQTLYSLRFVWSEESQLTDVVSTLWDRQRYREWESALGDRRRPPEEGKQEMENRKSKAEP